MQRFVDFVKSTMAKKFGSDLFLPLEAVSLIFLGALLLKSSFLPFLHSTGISSGLHQVERAVQNAVSTTRERSAIVEEKGKVQSFCAKLRKEFLRYNWKQEPCGDAAWLVFDESPQGHPLKFLEIGAAGPVTLILSGVHPDELNPVPIGYALAKHLKGDGDPILHDRRVVIAPLVNPDGFLREHPTRTNALGVDLNRNFPTKDWDKNALSRWKSKGKDPRRFPGSEKSSEIETAFMIHLIDTYKPEKIVSIHAPLGFLDYDGPGDRKPSGLSAKEKNAKDLANVISLEVGDYKVVDYAFFPGSLGNYAGNERGIPTVTVELKSSDPVKFSSYWEKFRPGLIASIKHNANKSVSH